MVKEKRILSYFIGWLIIGFCIMFIGVNKIFASTYNSNQFTAQLYDNYGPALTAVSTELVYGWEGKLPQMVANSSGGAWGISSPIPIVADHSYAMTIQIEGTYGGSIILSTYNRIGIGSTMSSAESSYEENTKVNEISSKSLSDGMTLQFVFTATSNASYIVFPFATSSSGTNWEFILNNVIIDDLGTDSVTQDEINSSLTNQTNELNNSINNSTNTITGAITDTENNINSNIDDMEQSIIDSNKETQDVIKDQFNSCRDSYNLLKIKNTIDRGLTTVVNNDGSITVSGTATGNFAYLDTGEYFNFEAGTYTFSIQDTLPLRFRLFLYNGSTEISNHTITSRNKSITFTTSQSITSYSLILLDLVVGTSYNFTIKPMLQIGSYATDFEPYGVQICQNKIDETNNQLGDLNNNITDDSAPNIDGLADSAGWLPPGPLDSVLNLPLSLFNALTTNLGKSCTPINLPLPFVNTNFQLPCISTLYEQIGISSLMSWVGVIASGFMLYSYLLKLYKWIEDRISLNETHSVDNWGGL